MLHLLFRKKSDAISKQHQLKDEFDIELNPKMTGELNIMCNLGEGIFEDGVAEGLQLGETRKAEKIAINMLNDGKTFEELEKWTELSLKRIQELASSIQQQ